MKRGFLCISVCILFFPITAFSASSDPGSGGSQVESSDSSPQQMSFDSAVESNSLLVASSSLGRECGWYAYERLDKKDFTVIERQEKLEAILFCMQEKTSAQSASLLGNGALNQSLAVETATAPLTDKVKRDKQKADSEVDFLGLSWGLGFGFSFSSDDAIDDADIVDGVVRVKSNKKQQPRAILEFHKFLWCNEKMTIGTRGCGPFVAVAATQDDVLSGVGVGFMYGLKAKPSDSDGFSIGIGAILDGDVKDLADGFKKNQAPPGGETSVRYETESRWSALVFVTRTF